MPFHHKRELSTSTASDWDDAPAKPAARRVVLACLECRSRRCKCDGAQPSCSNCIKHGRPACQYKAVTAEENLQARRRKNLVEHTRSTVVAGSSKAHRSAAQRRSKAAKRTRDEEEEEAENEEDAEGKDHEEYTHFTISTDSKAAKHRRVSSSSSSSVQGSSSTHTPIPLLPLPSSLPPLVDTTSTVVQEQPHRPLYYSCQPASSMSMSISLPPFGPAGAVASPYPTPFSPPTASINLGSPQHASHEASHPSFFPFHYPSAPQQQFILFQPPPSSPPSAYHQPLPYSHPNYFNSGYMVHQPLPTPYWPNPPSADKGYPFPTSFGAPMPSSYAYVSTGAPGLGVEVPYPMYETQHTIIYPNGSTYPPYACPPSSFAPPAPTTSAPTPAHPIDSPPQLPTPSSGPSSPTLTSASSAFDLSLGLEELAEAPLQATTTMALKMERHWSQQQEQQRMGSPFSLAGAAGEWTC